ncbi:MFS general substrate transporter [Aulographum hederae CBS 113979]|uniref:MFS general substrate transporter n=1 Tax=Aulographum hederae CBS 113979 TaxID=1176131 RepID=A0A6G1GUL7_9PEZI|nr:MFS general substrate transporter [Aulographum hederae CBS 113979]
MKSRYTTIVEAGVPRAQPVSYLPRTGEEKALDRGIDLKMDCAVVLVLALCFLFQGIDRSNIGNAATTSFVEDANLGPDDVPNAVSLFAATYVPLQPISVVIGRRVGPKYWISGMMLVWGGLSIAHAGIKSSGTLIALRLLLGAAEAGFVQTSLYYLSTLYPKYKYGFRSGLFSGMYSFAGAFSGLIAYGLLQIDSASLKNWQILFIFEGAVTCLLGVLVLLVIPKSLSTAWFLTPEQRRHAVWRMQMDVGQPITSDLTLMEGKAVSRRDWVDAVRDWKKMGIVICNITAILPVTAFSTFLPLVVQGMGYHGVRANLMSVPPFTVGACGLLVFVYSSDRFQERSLHIVSGMGLAIVGLIIMVVSKDPELRYGFTHVCLAGAFVAGPLIAAWLAGNTPDKATRSVVLGINGYSNLAGVIAGQLFKKKYAPDYRFPLIITMILMAVGIVGLLFFRFAYMYTNKWRKEKLREGDEGEEWRRGDQRFEFVYGL